MKIVFENGVLVEVKFNDYSEEVKEFCIPDGVIRLADESLAYLPMGVETLYIPSSVEEITEEALFGEVPNWESLKTIIVEEGNKNYKSEKGCLIDVKNNTVILGTENAIIPNGIEKIGFFAFRQRENLTEITIPASVKEVDMQAFACCRNLKKVTVLGENTNIDKLCFIADVAIEEFNLPKNSNYEFVNGALVKKSCKTLLLLTEKGEISKDVKSIESCACVRYFKDVIVPKTVIDFGENAIMLFGGGKIISEKDSPVIKYAKKNNLNYIEK